MRIILLLSLVGLSACARYSNNECGDKFLLLQPTGEQTFEFKEVLLSTLKSPYQLRGAAAEIFFEGIINESGYTGPVAEPKLTRNGNGVCVPMDAGSSIALTTYSHFERIYKFDQALGIDHQVTWPRKVGVEIRLRGGAGIAHNNAHYFASSDSIGVVPYTQGGLPLSLNPGILAHEHFHGHFQSQVNVPLNLLLSTTTVSSIDHLFYNVLSVKPQVEDVETADPSTPGGLNKFVIRSWNEGLADFYGGVFSEQADSFSASLAKLEGSRDLSGPIRPFRPTLELVLQIGWGQEYRRNMVGASYVQGATLARLMYAISLSGSMEQKAFLTHVMTRLKYVPAAVAPIFNLQMIEFEHIVPILIEGVPLNAFACTALNAALSKNAMLRSFPKCAL